MFSWRGGDDLKLRALRGRGYFETTSLKGRGYESVQGGRGAPKVSEIERVNFLKDQFLYE